MTSTFPAPMRADARRNRALILEAAEAAFAVEGLGVTVDEIASRAGVGAGTLYRHFPTKEALFEAVVIHHIDQIADHGEGLVGEEEREPGPALFEFMTLLGTQGASKRNLVEALSGAGVDMEEAAEAGKARVEQAFTTLLTRAQQAGAVRPDVTTADLFALVMGTCMIAGHEVPESSQERMLSIVCAGLRPAEAAGVAPPA